MLVPSIPFNMRLSELLVPTGSRNVLQYALYCPTLFIHVRFDHISILVPSKWTFWFLPVDVRYAPTSSCWKPLPWKMRMWRKLAWCPKYRHLQNIHSPHLPPDLGHLLRIIRTLIIHVAVMDVCKNKYSCQILYHNNSAWVVVLKHLYSISDFRPSMFCRARWSLPQTEQPFTPLIHSGHRLRGLRFLRCKCVLIGLRASSGFTDLLSSPP